jgi:uncharacterized membrane protein YvlD (DUF360 family)
MVQVALSILKPAGSVGAVFSLTVNAPAPNLTNATGADQIAIISFAITNILLKVMSVMAKPIIAIWSAPVAFARLGASAFTVKEKLP